MQIKMIVPIYASGNSLYGLFILFPLGVYKEGKCVLIYSVISSDKQNANGRIVHL